MNFQLVQPFGFSEMYEWKDVPEKRFGYLVELDGINTAKIIKARDPNNVIGVTSINFSVLSDNPSINPNKYQYNEHGDIFVEKKAIARGVKKYNQVDEFAFISTYKDYVYTPVLNIEYDKTLKYVQPIDNDRFSAVTLLGKAIVIDNGLCNESYCQLYTGIDEQYFGTVVNVYNDFAPKYRILKRYSPKTIMILIK